MSEAEKLIDQFFRRPEDRQVLIPVPNQLAAMRGVLSVLGMEQATAALLRMRDEVEGLVQTEIDPQRIVQTGLFDRLAGNLGALGFLIDMLSVQPQMAKSLFVFDPRTGTLDPVMGRGPSHRPMSTPMPVEPRLIEQAQALAFNAARPDIPVAEVARDLERLSHEASVADQTALVEKVERTREALARADEADDREGVASVRGELTDVLVDFVSSTSEPMGLDASLAPVRAATVAAPVPLSATAELAEDDEMREVFLEEAREVLHDAGVATADLAHAPSDLALLTTVRRAFHTLKGSSRMVGLKEFGEAAWACEQMYNTQLADHRAAGPELIDFTNGVLARLGDWVADIAAHRDTARTAAAIKAAAQRLAAGEAALPLVTAPAPLSEAEALSAFGLTLPPDLPSAEALELPAMKAAPAATAPEVAFELDLSALDGVAAEPPSAASVDFDVPALDEPFDAQATQPLPLSEMPASGAVPVDLSFDLIDLDLGGDAANQLLVETIEPSADLPLEIGEAAPATTEDENVKIVGTLRIGIPLFNIYLNEADELSRRLTTELAEWAMELHRPIGETPIALAHSLAGSSATVGFNDLSQLARPLEHAQMRSQSIGYGTPEEARLFVDAAEEIRRLLHQFAAGFLKEPAPELLARLAEHEIESARRLEAATAAADLPPATGIGELDEAPVMERIDLSEPPAPQPEPETRHERPAAAAPSSHAPFFETSGMSVSSFGALDARVDALGVAELKPLAELPTAPARGAERELAIEGTEDIDAVDAVDAELFPIFEEEGQDLLPQLSTRLRDWARRPGETSHAASCMRTLHTLKGGARLAGAMRLGEMAHRLETRIEQILANPPIVAADVEQLQMRGDALSQVFEALRARDAQAYEEASAAVVAMPVAGPSRPRRWWPRRCRCPSRWSLRRRPNRRPAVAAEAIAPEPPLAKGEPVALPPVSDMPPIDWSRFALGGVATRVVADKSQSASQSAVRVRAPLLDRLVNQAGEV